MNVALVPPALLLARATRRRARERRRIIGRHDAHGFFRRGIFDEAGRDVFCSDYVHGLSSGSGVRSRIASI